VRRISSTACNTMLRSYFETFRSSRIVRRLWQSKVVVEEKNPKVDETTYTICIQDILSWRDKRSSLLGLIVTYIALWLTYLISFQPYLVLSMAVIVSVIHDAWIHHIWPEISLPGSSSLLCLPKIRFVAGEELRCHLDNVIKKLDQFFKMIMQLRAHNSGLVATIPIFNLFLF